MGKTDIRSVEIMRALHNNPDVLLCEAARRRLLWFTQYTNPNFEVTDFHRTYYTILDKFAHREINKLIIQAPPQHGKSEGSSRTLPAFLLGLEPDLKIGICSYAATIAKDFNRDIQRIIDTEKYLSIFPATTLADSKLTKSDDTYSRNSDVFEIVGRKGSLRAVGRGGSLTSKTLDVGIMDDLYKDALEANSPVIRSGAWDWYTKVFRSRLHNNSRQLIVFTRWHKDDIIGKIIEAEKVIVAKSWADLEDVPSDTWVLVNFEAIKTGAPTELDPREPGEPLWNDRHSKENLEAQRRIDPNGFQCLYQGNPESAEGRLFEPFKTWVDKSDWGTYVRSGCYIDVADEGSDYLAAVSYDVYKSANQIWNEAKHKFEPLLFYLVTGIDFTDENSDVTLVTVANMINMTGSQKVWVESNNGGRQYERQLAKRVRASTVAFHQSDNKESRIITNAPFVNQSVVMPFGWETRHERFYKHVTEFLREFSANEHDDGVDCLTGIVEKESRNFLPYAHSNRGITVR